MDAKVEVAVLVAGVGGAAYLAGYDPVGIGLTWIEQGVEGSINFGIDLTGRVVSGLYDATVGRVVDGIGSALPI